MSELIGSDSDLSTSITGLSTRTAEVVSAPNNIVPTIAPVVTTPVGVPLVKSGAPGATGFLDGAGRILLGQHAGTSLLEWALRYAEHGYYVFPLRDGSKYPTKNCRSCDDRGDFYERDKHQDGCTVHSGPSTCHGHKAATRDLEVIRQWWMLNPHSNIGVNMGRSGVAVLDVDTRAKDDGTYKVGGETIAALLETHGELPDGPRVTTWSGGWQRYLSHPPGMLLKSSAGSDIHMTGLGQDVDIKALSAYAVAPPSIITGKNDRIVRGQYTWATPAWDTLPEVPAWIPQVVKEREATKRPRRTYSARPWSTDPAPAESVREQVQKLSDEVSNAPEGTRNNLLNKNAFKAFQYAAAGQIDPDEVEFIFTQAGCAADPRDTAQVERTVASARNGAANKPYVWRTRSNNTSAAAREGQAVTENVDIPEQRAEGHSKTFFDVLRSFSPDHLGLAEYFHEIQDGKSYVRWDSGSCSFIVYRQDRGHWQRDDAKSTILGQMISKLAKRVRAATEEAILASPANAVIEAAKGGAEIKKEELAEAKADVKAMRSWYNVLANAGGHHSVVKMLSTLIESTMPGEFDSRSSLMNFKNGTYDVRTGEMHAHTADDMLVHRVEYELDLSLADKPLSVAAPRFHSLVTRMCYAEGEVDAQTAHGRYSAVTRFLGYLLHGSNPEKMLGVFEGGTDTGKNQAVEVVGNIIGGGLAWLAARPQLLIKGSGQRHDSDEYSMTGKRMVLVNELTKQQHLDEGQVLRFVGPEGTVVGLRRMRQDREDVPITWTMVVTTNELPKANLTPQVVNRIRLFPLSQVSVPKEEQYDIKRIILEEEAEAVLAHLVTWWREWYLDYTSEKSPTGLIVTQEMVDALTAYEAENTSLHQQYFEEELERGDFTTTPKDIWNGFNNWMTTENPDVVRKFEIGRREFTKELYTLKGVTFVEESIGGGRKALRAIKGIRVRPRPVPQTWMEMQAAAR